MGCFRSKRKRKRVSGRRRRRRRKRKRAKSERRDLLLAGENLVSLDRKQREELSGAQKFESPIYLVKPRAGFVIS